MPNVFQQVTKPLNNEQIAQIAKTGVVPSSMKGPEDKLYIVILRENEEMYTSDCIEVNGFAIIAVGRKNVFDKVKDYLDSVERTVDFEKSIVLVEGVDAGKGISLTKFINLCNNSYPDEAFELNIEEPHMEERQATGFGGNAGTLMNE